MTIMPWGKHILFTIALCLLAVGWWYIPILPDKGTFHTIFGIFLSIIAVFWSLSLLARLFWLLVLISRKNEDDE
jgi:hypothetical protein